MAYLPSRSGETITDIIQDAPKARPAAQNVLPTYTPTRSIPKFGAAHEQKLKEHPSYWRLQSAFDGLIQSAKVIILNEDRLFDLADKAVNIPEKPDRDQAVAIKLRQITNHQDYLNLLSAKELYQNLIMESIISSTNIITDNTTYHRLEQARWNIHLYQQKWENSTAVIRQNLRLNTVYDHASYMYGLQYHEIYFGDIACAIRKGDIFMTENKQEGQKMRRDLMDAMAPFCMVTEVEKLRHLLDIEWPEKQYSMHPRAHEISQEWLQGHVVGGWRFSSTATDGNQGL